jgi:arylesterase / paraoxonase
MRSDVKEAYKRELALARQARRARDLEGAVVHLERAHILGQRYLLPHFHTHALLFAVAAQRVDAREMAGQVVRLIAVVPGYLSGWVPKGNTGSANVSALLPMKPPEDLAALVATHSVARDVAVRVVLWSVAAFAYYMIAMPRGMEVFLVR